MILASVLMLAVAPAIAHEGHPDDNVDDSDEPENHSDIEEDEDMHEEDERDQHHEGANSEMDGTDNSTAIEIGESEAFIEAGNSLSENNWTLEDSSTHEEDGYYEFEFVVEGEDAEAEVRVDGSSGEVFRHEEDLEKESEDEAEDLERVEVQNLEQAKERIEKLRGMVIELRKEVVELEGGESETEAEFERREGSSESEDEHGQETEAEVEHESGETETEAEVEREGPSEEARENVNGTPGNDQAEDNRPGFVSRMLGGFFS